MKFRKRTLAATLVASGALGVSAPVWADAGGVAAGLLGGMVLGRAINESRQDDRASAYNSGYSAGSYSAPPQTVYVQPAAPSQPSVEQRVAELDSMHKKGLISDSEYSSRKKAILDSL